MYSWGAIWYTVALFQQRSFQVFSETQLLWSSSDFKMKLTLFRWENPRKKEKINTVPDALLEMMYTDYQNWNYLNG